MNPDGEQKKPSPWSVAGDWLKTIIIALIIALPIRYFIAEPFIVSGASMDPTFASGQFLIVDRLTYRLEAPQRGDVVIFEYPNDVNLGEGKIYFIKRIIGLPGETVKIDNGAVTIINKDNPNGMALNAPYVEPIHESHDTSTQILSDTQYFVMGDNRAESSDSRSWGPLESHFIVGRPIVRLLPLSAISVLPGQYR